MKKQNILVRTYPNSRNKFTFDGWSVTNTESGVEIILPNKKRAISLSFQSNGVEVNYWSGNQDNLNEVLDTKTFRG